MEPQVGNRAGGRRPPCGVRQHLAPGVLDDHESDHGGHHYDDGPADDDHERGTEEEAGALATG
jgi:hypothetical protein